VPVTRRTWAPRGHTPVIGHHFNWSAPRWLPRVCYGSRAGGAAVAFYHHPDAYDTDGLIGALGQLRRFLGGQQADARLAAPAAALAGGGAAARLRTELNPVEGL
jgi:hypothetical protein